MQKTHKKSAAFWKHGKHASILPQARQEEREKLRKPSEPMRGSIAELMRVAKKKQK